MIAFLYKLLIGSFHVHKWETYKINLATLDGDKVGENHYQKCEECNDVRIKKLHFK